MNTTKSQSQQDRMPQALRTPLPELAEFLAPLRVQFTQGPSAVTLRRYVTGLFSEQPNKNCDTLAEVVPALTYGCSSGRSPAHVPMMSSRVSGRESTALACSST